MVKYYLCLKSLSACNEIVYFSLLCLTQKEESDSFADSQIPLISNEYKFCCLSDFQYYNND